MSRLIRPKKGERFSPETRDRIAEARWCEFNTRKIGSYTLGLTYHKCRFCRVGLGDVGGLFKYAVRHYICGSCREVAMRERGADTESLATVMRERFRQGR